MIDDEQLFLPGCLLYSLGFHFEIRLLLCCEVKDTLLGEDLEEQFSLALFPYYIPK